MDARCPYCHDLLEKQNLPVCACEGCGTPFHRVCIEELGRCTTLGCSEAGLDRERASPEALLLQALIELQNQTVWGSPPEEEVHAEVAHLCSLLSAAEVERVREEARKVSSLEHALERRRRAEEALAAEDAVRREERAPSGSHRRPAPPPLIDDKLGVGVFIALSALALVIRYLGGFG